MEYASRFPENMLIEIFLNLPPKSVFRFKCLSKAWNSRLSAKSFLDKYKSRHPSLLRLSGLFLHHDGSINGLRFFHQSGKRSRLGLFSPAEPVNLSFAPLLKENMNFINSRIDFFLGSSNGLILCGFPHPPCTLYVCNPVTDEWLELPPPPNNILSDAEFVKLGFQCEEHDTTALSYTVVRAGCQTINSKFLSIERYSSKTGAWTESLLEGADFFVPLNHPCTIVGGIFYQLVVPQGLVAYDPEAEHGRVWIITLSSSIDRLDRPVSLGQWSDGRLCCGLGKSVFKIHKLQKPVRDYSPHAVIPESEWIPIHSISFYQYPRDQFVAFHPQDCRLLLIIFDRKFFWYDIVNRQMTYIWSCSVFTSQLHSPWKLIPYFQPEWPPSQALL